MFNSIIEIIASIIALFTAFIAIKDFLQEKRKVKTQEAAIEEKIKIREEKATSKVSLIDFIKVELNVATERERLTMILAQSRSNRLYFIGIILMILSVFAPIASIFIYVTMNPLEPIEQLKALGLAPTNISNLPQKDWHILISGISFGLLFLAAARGIFRQEEQQRSTYFKLGRRITFYENIVSALRINNQLYKENEGPENTKLIEKIIDKLVEIPLWDIEKLESEKADSTEGINLKEIVEAIKK